jgi:DNA modification methylase
VRSFAKAIEEDNLLALHPTVKPVALVADALMDCSARGEIVLDVFLGSGTTVIAAERTGRRCYGLEIDPVYVDLAIRRFQNFTGEDVIHVKTGLTFAKMQRERSERGG